MVKDLDVDVLVGIPFMEYNDISVQPAVQKIYFSTGSSCSYGKTTSNPTHKVRRAHILRAPNKLTTMFPGEFVEAPVPDEIANISVAIEPCLDTHHPNWPLPEFTKSIEGIVRVPNLTAELMTLKHCEHIRQVYSPKSPKDPDFKMHKTATHPNTTLHSSTVSVDPDEILPVQCCSQLLIILKELDSVFNTQSGGYNGAVFCFMAVVNMDPSKPPQRKGRLPQYTRTKLEELQELSPVHRTSLATHRLTTHRLTVQVDLVSHHWHMVILLSKIQLKENFV